MNNQTVSIENETYFTLVRERLDVGNEVWIPVKGKSMLPFLRERDDALLQPVGEGDVVIGDIVLARWAQKYILHRVVRKKSGVIWLAGDNNLVQLEMINLGDVIAVLTAARRNKKRLSVSSPLYKLLGMCWYYLRLPRRVVVGLKRRVSMCFS